LPAGKEDEGAGLELEVELELGVVKEYPMTTAFVVIAITVGFTCQSEEKSFLLFQRSSSSRMRKQAVKSPVV